MIYLFITIIVVSYVSLQTIETISFGSRIAGKASSRLALGTTLQHSIYTLSRIFLVALLPTLAYLVEKEISIELYAIIATIALFSTFLIVCFVLFKLNGFQKIFQKIFKSYEDHHMPTAIIRVVFGKLKVDSSSLISIPRFSMNYVVQKKTIVSVVAYTFLSTGFFVTFFLALIYYDYRLTISQLAALFHGIGATIVAFYLDPMLSRSLDKVTDESWLLNMYSILLGRAISYFISSIAFIAIFITWTINAN